MSKPLLYITENDAGLELSAEEYAEAEFQRPHQYERAHRRIVVLPPPSHEHHVIAGIIRNHLGAYHLSHPEVVDYVFQESWLRVDDETDRHPDITVYLKGASSGDEIPNRVPDIIFEIVSPGADARDRDYIQKRNDYQQAGVREYVIVDRFEHHVTLLSLGDQSYAESILIDTDNYTSPLLPGLEIPLQGLI